MFRIIFYLPLLETIFIGYEAFFQASVFELSGISSYVFSFDLPRLKRFEADDYVFQFSNSFVLESRVFFMISYRSSITRIH